MDDLIPLIEAEIPRLRRFARYLARDIDRADDLVQDALVRAISNLDKWQRGTNLRSWLFVILRNIYINSLRKQRSAPPAAELREDDQALGIAGGQEAHQAMREMEHAFHRLSEEHREVLLLVAVEGLEYEEAANVLDVPIGTVRSRLSRARTTLRDLLQGETDRIEQEQSL